MRWTARITSLTRRVFGRRTRSVEALFALREDARDAEESLRGLGLRDVRTRAVASPPTRAEAVAQAGAHWTVLSVPKLDRRRAARVGNLLYASGAEAVASGSRRARRLRRVVHDAWYDQAATRALVRRGVRLADRPWNGMARDVGARTAAFRFGRMRGRQRPANNDESTTRREQ